MGPSSTVIAVTMAQRSAAIRPPDLADHFVACSKLGRHLTFENESRFVISDDFRGDRARMIGPVATAVASVWSADPLVAQAALLPLGATARDGTPDRRSRYEELFALIEEHAIGGAVQESARALLEDGFDDARLRAVEADLGQRLNPARHRYRAFLGVVRHLIDGKISPGAFRDEFVEFTYAVAGRLDFGIYSLCLDRMVAHPRIPLRVKGLLIQEVVKFPPLICRELVTNVLAAPATDAALAALVRDVMAKSLSAEAVLEVHLLEAVKRSRLSVADIERQLRTDAGGHAILVDRAGTLVG